MTGALLIIVSGCSGKDGKSCTVTSEADGSATIRCEDGTSVTVPAGKSGSSCTVTDEGNGTKRITCGDGTTAIVSNGAAGADGGSCTVSDADGGKLIRCDDGTTALVTNGANGSSCSITDNGDGSKTIRCGDGTTVTVRDGVNAAAARVLDRHGEDHVQSSGELAAGKFLVEAVITGASASDAGVVTVDFRVRRPNGTPVVDVASVSANVARLGSIDFAPPMTGAQFTRWVPYLSRTETVQDAGFPNPPGTTAVQAARESTGALVNHRDGTYTYTFATNVSNVTVGGVAVPFERNRKHRVSVMLGGHTGATATATYDFVPDGSSDARTRDIVRTSACQQCHGANFQAHGGDRMTVENCVTCHVPGTSDAQGGQSLDLRVMIHKIHRGGDLPSVAGPDGDPWATADNGEYAIWGYGDQKHEWRTAGFPAR